MAENNSKTKKTASPALGKFFPPMWLLGICAIGAVVLCIFIFGWMINFEQRYADLQEHRDILASLPGLKQQQSEIQRDLDSKNEELRLLRSNIREKNSELNELITRKKEAELQNQTNEKLEAFSQELKQKLDSLSSSVDSLSSSAAAMEGAVNKLSSQGSRMEGDADAFSASGKKMQEKLTDLFNAVSENNIRQKTQDYNRAIETLEGSFKSLSQQMEAGKGSIGSMADSLRGTSTDLQKVKKDLNDAAQSARYNLENAVSQITKDYIQEVKKLEDSFKSLSQQMDAGKASVGSMTDSLRGTSTDLQKIKKDLNDAAQAARYNLEDAVRQITKHYLQEIKNLEDGFKSVSQQIEAGKSSIGSIADSLRGTNTDLQKITKDYGQEARNLENSFRSLSQQMEASKASIGSVADSLQGINTDLQKIKKDLNDAAGSAGKNIGDIPADLDKVQQTLQAQSLRLEECLKQLSESAARLPSVSASQAETLETLEKLKKLLKENGGKQGDAPDGPQSNGSASQKQE